MTEPLTIRPSVSVDAHSETDGGTDGSGLIEVEHEKQQQGPTLPALATPAEGALVLMEVARRQPKLAVAGKVLADQALRIEGLLAGGWAAGDLVEMLAVEPPADMRTPGGILSARIGRVPHTPAQLPRQDAPANGGSGWLAPTVRTGVDRTVAEALADRGAKTTCIDCGRMPAPGFDRCARCMDWPHCITCLPGPTARRANPESDGRCSKCADARGGYPALEAAQREMEGAR